VVKSRVNGDVAALASKANTPLEHGAFAVDPEQFLDVVRLALESSFKDA
jgi:hypothetical protein